MALRPSNPSNQTSYEVIDLTGDSSDSESSRSSSPIIFFGPVSSDVSDSDSSNDTVENEQSPSDEDDVVGLCYSEQILRADQAARQRPKLFHSSVFYHGFSPLSAFTESEPRLKSESSFIESSYVPAHTARLFWVKSGPSRWVKMSAFVPDTEHWASFFHVSRNAPYFPKTLQYELIGLSTVLQMRGLSDLRFLFVDLLISSDVFNNFDYSLDRTTIDKIDHVIAHMYPHLEQRFIRVNPCRGLTEGLDRPFCINCGEPSMRFLPGVRKASIDLDAPNDWKARLSHDARHGLCDPCKNRTPLKIRSFSRSPGEQLEIVANMDPRYDIIVKHGTRRFKAEVKPELWLKSDYVCPITGSPRKLFPWDEAITLHCPDNVVLELVLVHPQRWSLSPRHCETESYVKAFIRNYFPTGRNHELCETAFLVRGAKNYGDLNIANPRRFRTSMNFLSVAPGGFPIRDTWQLKGFGTDSESFDYGRNLYGQLRYNEVPANGTMRYFILRRFVHDADMNRYDAFELTPPGRFFGQSALALRKANALYWLLAFADLNPLEILEVSPASFLHPKDNCFSPLYLRY